MRFLTIDEVACRLKVSPVTIRRRIRSGLLRALRNGRLLRIREKDLEEMFKRHDTMGWGNLSADSFVEDWNNPYDAVYDDWRRSRGPAKR